LGEGQLLSYESFFIEIIKVLTIIVQRLPSGNMIYTICNDKKIFNFLIWVAKNAKQTNTKEHVYYTISLFALKLFRIDDVPRGKGIYPQVDSEQLEKIADILFLIIEHSSNSASAQSSPLVQKAFRNMAKIFQSQFVIHQLKNDNHRVHHYFKRRYCLLK
jgi:hypothetical protein